MATWIALFRGINVGGNNILPMAELRAGLETLKLKHVRSYIQSGNVVFNSTAKSADALGNKITKWVDKDFGFSPRVLVMSVDDLEKAIAQNPYPSAANEPKTLHFFFLEKPPESADTKALDKIKLGNEHYQIKDRVFYLHSPDGIGRSKLAANAEKHLGVATTARNFRTVMKLLVLCKSGE